LFEAHRCRNALYWALRGYWRWSVPQLARWLGIPVFAGLVLVVVAAEYAGGLGIIPDLPHQPPHVAAQAVEVLAWLVGGVFVALREHKCVWVIDRVTTAWLVPAKVRESLLDASERAECRRAVGYTIGVTVFFGTAFCSALISRWTERFDGFATGMIALAIPIGLAASLPPNRMRNFAFAVLAIAAAAPLFAVVPGAVGWSARLSFLIAFCAATPALILLHARAARLDRTHDGSR
jgi:hypothetical protein